MLSPRIARIPFFGMPYILTLESEACEEFDFVPQRGLFPVVAFLGEGGLEDGLEEFAGVVEVFLGLGGGRRDPLKGFIQDPHDPLLLGKGRDGKLNFFVAFRRQVFVQSESLLKSSISLDSY